MDLSPPERRGRDMAKHLTAKELRDFLEVARRKSPLIGLMMTTLYETGVRVREFTAGRAPAL